jgi:hypothetical protein
MNPAFIAHRSLPENSWSITNKNKDWFVVRQN